MGKTRRQPEEAGRNGRDGRGEAGYFLSLTLDNVRCFGAEPQTLDLSRGGERPARWTVILGENGTGKTTLLQALAGLELLQSELPLPSKGAENDTQPEGVLRSKIPWGPPRLLVHGTLRDDFYREE